MASQIIQRRFLAIARTSGDADESVADAEMLVFAKQRELDLRRNPIAMSSADTAHEIASSVQQSRILKLSNRIGAD